MTELGFLFAARVDQITAAHAATAADTSLAPLSSALHVLKRGERLRQLAAALRLIAGSAGRVQVFVVEVNPGQEVIETVTSELSSRGVLRGAIVSLVGAIDSCCINNMPKDNPKSDILTEYHQPFEMAGTGEIKDGKPHIHCILGSEGDTSLAGHLHWARVENWFVNVYIAEMGT